MEVEVEEEKEEKGRKGVEGGTQKEVEEKNEYIEEKVAKDEREASNSIIVSFTKKGRKGGLEAGTLIGKEMSSVLCLEPCN